MSFKPPNFAELPGAPSEYSRFRGRSAPWCKQKPAEQMVILGGFHGHAGTPKWMVFVGENDIFKS